MQKFGNNHGRHNNHNNHNNHGNHNHHNNHGNNHGNNRENHRENRRDNNRDDNQAINNFELGMKELEDKVAHFQYDKGWYSIIDVIGEEKTLVYKSKNAQEAYTKWNVYIGRKKERPQRAEKAES